MDTASPSNGFLVAVLDAALEGPTHFFDLLVALLGSVLTVTLHDDFAVPEFLQSFENDLADPPIANAPRLHVTCKLISRAAASHE